MKIYTRSGDKGKTSVIGGQRLMKDADRVATYGELDELNSLIGLIRSLSELKNSQFQNLDHELLEIQHLLFDAGTDMANIDETIPFRLDERAVQWLEKKIDEYETKVPKIEKFILPGGSVLSSWLHYARTVARRVERSIVHLMQKEAINEQVLIFVNRLSDYLFVVARFVNTYSDQEEVFYRNSDRVFKN